MTPSTTTGPTLRTFEGLVADEYGDRSDQRPPLVLLHGLTFDRFMWGPTVAVLQEFQPGRHVLAFDLPGHGESPWLPTHGGREVTEAIGRAVQSAGLAEPVIVGHSASAITATFYPLLFPARGVINVDQSLRFEPFVKMVLSLEDRLRGPAYPQFWQLLLASMHLELLPSKAQDLLNQHSTPRQDLVISYWSDLLTRPVEDISRELTEALQQLARHGVAYQTIFGADPEPDYESWLTNQVPQATTEIWSGSGHFPHLAHPRRFAQLLAASAAIERHPTQSGRLAARPTD